MDSATAGRLLELNREFYSRFGAPFSATRQRIQPGVRRVLERLSGHEAILDLGCGNGELARVLGRRNHRGPYLGVDFSLPLLREAASTPEGFSAKFIEADLTRLSALREQVAIAGGWSWVTAFAVLHHLPSRAWRLDLLRTVYGLLAPGGVFVHSQWQFLNSEKLRARIQPWEAVAGLGESDAGDFILDWRSGGTGLRYVHHFTEAELRELAEATGFTVHETFYSDGATGNLGLYQVWGK